MSEGDPEEQRRAGQVREDHDLLSIEPIAERAGQGTHQSQRPEREEERGGDPRGRVGALVDDEVERHVRGGPTGQGDGSRESESSNGGSGSGDHGTDSWCGSAG